MMCRELVPQRLCPRNDRRSRPRQVYPAAQRATAPHGSKRAVAAGNTRSAASMSTAVYTLEEKAAASSSPRRGDV